MCGAALSERAAFLLCADHRGHRPGHYSIDRKRGWLHEQQARFTPGGAAIGEIWRGLVEAVRLILSGDPDLYEIILLSLRVSGTALLFSTLIGIPLGVLLGLSLCYSQSTSVLKGRPPLPR